MRMGDLFNILGAKTRELLATIGVVNVVQEGRRRRLEMAWTAADREAVEGFALAAEPREGAVIALCRWSTGETRDTLILSEPIPPEPGDLSYHRGHVVTVTARYWNRAIDKVRDAGDRTGLAVLHTHPGSGIPDWSGDDDVANQSLAAFLFGERFLSQHAPLLSLVATHSDLRGRAIAYDQQSGNVAVRSVERVRTVSLEQIAIASTADRVWPKGQPMVPAHADRSVRVFGKEGQRLLADLHIAVVGTGGVGSICGEHLARWGIGNLSAWDPDIVKDVNINRSGIFTFADATKGLPKAKVLSEALRLFSLVRDLASSWRQADIRDRRELPALLDADIIVMLVDDPRPRHFINRLAFMHYIPTLDGGNAIRSSAEDDAHAKNATVQDAGVRVSYLTPGGPCLWCAGHLTSQGLSLAYRPESDKAADRARGYVEHLGPEHAPSVMPVNAMTSSLLEIRLQNLLFGLSRRPVAEVYFDVLENTVDELTRSKSSSCRQCSRWESKGDSGTLEFADSLTA